MWFLILVKCTAWVYEYELSCIHFR